MAKDRGIRTTSDKPIYDGSHIRESFYMKRKELRLAIKRLQQSIERDIFRSKIGIILTKILDIILP